MPFLVIIYAGGMCAGSAYLACEFARRCGFENFAVLGISVATGGIVYLLVLVVCGSCLKRFRKPVFQ